MKMPDRPGDPIPRPKNVRLVNKETKEEIICELAWVGINDEGVREWKLLSAFNPKTHELKMDTLPAMTGIFIPWEGDNE